MVLGLFDFIFQFRNFLRIFLCLASGAAEEPAADAAAGVTGGAFSPGAPAAGCGCVSGEPGILSCSAVALCTSPFFTSRVSSVITLAGFAGAFFFSRARRAASATD